MSLNAESNHGALPYSVEEHTYHLDLRWLRHNCPCSHCIHPGTGQKTIPTAQLTALSQLNSLDSTHPDTMSIKWQNGHQSHYTTDWLREQLTAWSKNPTPHLVGEMAIQLPDPPSCRVLPTHTYQAIQRQSCLFELLYDINLYGAAIIEQVPCQNNMVAQIANQIGPLQTTMYGSVFNVQAQPDPINIAYTQESIDLHMDLMYYESPPGLQLLHCLAFDDDIVGGESLLLDSFEMLKYFQQQSPEALKTLCRIPATFQKIHLNRTRPVHMIYERPHIGLNGRQHLIGFHWSPAFEGPLRAYHSDITDYYDAYIQLSQMMQQLHPTIGHTFRLTPGSLLIFNNRRMLHGRQAFQLAQPHQQRHLQGAYINIDDYKSQLQILRNKFKMKKQLLHFGNQDWHASS